jgi:hypothetical protein
MAVVAKLIERDSGCVSLIFPSNNSISTILNLVDSRLFHVQYGELLNQLTPNPMK